MNASQCYVLFTFPVLFLRFITQIISDYYEQPVQLMRWRYINLQEPGHKPQDKLKITNKEEEINLLAPEFGI